MYRKIRMSFCNKILLTGVILSALFTAQAVAVSYDMPKTPETMSVQTPAEQLFFVTVRIEIEKPGKDGEPIKEISTGFMVNYHWGNDKSGHFLVTNKHAVSGATNGRFFFIRAKDNQPLLGETYNIEIKDFQNRWYGNKDPLIDIAVMPMEDILEEIQKKGWHIFFRAVTKDISLDRERARKLDAIEPIIFIGYPSGIYDFKNFLPVARRGITATPLSVDYSGLPQFLIDASVFPGSSGSPVFIYDTGSHSNRKGQLVIGNRFMFLGIISGMFTRKENSEWEFDGEEQGVPVIKTQQMIDIAGVYKASVIFDTIEELLEERGYK